jgi:hypothetical protein
MPFRPTLEQRGGPVRPARGLRCSGHIARRAAAQLRQTVPVTLAVFVGRRVAICIPEEGGAGCGASLSAFASEDAPYDPSTAVTGVSWPKLPTPLSGVRAATSVPDESGEGRTGSLAALVPRDVSFETLAVVCAEACSERSSLSTSPVAVCAWTPLP